MTRRSLSRILRLPLAALVVSCLGAPALAGNPGDAGVLSLRLGVGAREAGMGEAGAASSTGAAAVWWNPANNVFADFETEVVLQTQRYVGLFDQHAAAVAHKAGGGVIGVIFTGFYSDEITRYDEEPVGVPGGTFEPYDVAFGVSYARRLGESFGVGVTAKLVYEKIDIYDDKGFAFDFSLSHMSVIEGLRFGAALTNVGGQMQLKDQPFDLPTALRLGAAYTPAAEGLLGRLTLAGDVLMPNDTTEKAHLGAELGILPELAIRVGTRVNYESQGLTAGAGFRVGRLGVDYAYSDWTNDLDDGHKFSLSITW
jgi:hypothetical protein